MLLSQKLLTLFRLINEQKVVYIANLQKCYINNNIETIRKLL